MFAAAKQTLVAYLFTGCLPVKYVGWARTVYIHRIWPYIWWFFCQNYRIYTVYIWFWPTLQIRTYPSSATDPHLIEEWKCLGISTLAIGGIKSLQTRPPDDTSRVGQNHTYKCIHGVCTIFLAGKLPIGTNGHMRCTYTALANLRKKMVVMIIVDRNVHWN